MLKKLLPLVILATPLLSRADGFKPLSVEYGGKQAQVSIANGVDAFLNHSFTHNKNTVILPADFDVLKGKFKGREISVHFAGFGGWVLEDTTIAGGVVVYGKIPLLDRLSITAGLSAQFQAHQSVDLGIGLGLIYSVPLK